MGKKHLRILDVQIEEILCLVLSLTLEDVIESLEMNVHITGISDDILTKAHKKIEERKEPPLEELLKVVLEIAEEEIPEAITQIINEGLDNLQDHEGRFKFTAEDYEGLSAEQIIDLVAEEEEEEERVILIKMKKNPEKYAKLLDSINKV